MESVYISRIDGQRRRVKLNLPKTLEQPTGIAADVHCGNTYVFVVDYHKHSVTRFSLNGNNLESLVTIGKPGNGDLDFNKPVGIAVHPKTHRVYVADTGNNRIKVLNNDLTNPHHFQGNHFKQPRDISFVKDNNGVMYMYVADYGNNRIQVFTVTDNNDGNAIQFVDSSTIGRGANRQRRVKQPDSVAAVLERKEVYIYISEKGKDHVSKYASNGTFIERFAPLPFRNPHGIAVDGNGTVYVCDMGNNRVQVLVA